MKDSITLQAKSSELLRTNKLAIALEIMAVFLPIYIGLAISDRIGSDHFSLGGDLVIRQGPLAYLGLAIGLVVLWTSSRLRGAGWRDYGLKRPKSWIKALLMSLGVALAVFGTVVFIINPLTNALPNLEPREMSSFDYLEGHLPNLIIQLANVWITAAFLEEFLFRGYLMNRLIDIQGKHTIFAWLLAIVVQAVVFALVHSQQGSAGMLKIGAIGLVFGFSYLAVGRNLWPLIIAHGFIDTIDMVSHYLGG